MEEETEVLDWGNEDDEVQTAESHRSALQQNGQDDVEDAVSLGGDEDDEIYPYKAAQPEDTSKAQLNTPRNSQFAPPLASIRREGQRENSGTSQQPPSQQSDSSQLRRSQSLGHMTHALPPKPAVAPPPFVPPTSTQTSTIASAMVPRDRRSNGHSKNLSASRDRDSGLPPDWEERLPRSGGREPYYYNVKTHESTWVRPGTGDSGPPSPANDRVQDVRGGQERTLPRGAIDETSRVSRKDDRRRVSPGGSFSVPHNKQDFQARPAGLPPRPQSPRAVDRRRERRSTTPPLSRRDTRPAEVAVRPRRDVSPPPDRNAVTREQRSSAQDGQWDRPRSTLTPDGRGRGYPPESNTPRGRRPRDEPPLEHLRPGQDSRDSYNPWSAPRPRTPPPPVRDQTPPRRYPEPDGYGHERERGRARVDHPASPPLDRSRATSSYGPVDSIPQRRGRDYDAEYENDPKRRRMEDDPYRRRSSPDRRPTTSPLVDRSSLNDTSSLSRADSRKRLPLPPQRDRFREVERGRSGEPPFEEKSALPPRTVENYHSLREAPGYQGTPAPRGPSYVPPSRGHGFERSSRYDDSHSRRDESRGDMMDVDYPHGPRGPGELRGDFPPPRSRGLDRQSLDLQTSGLPKGPRAMTRSTGSFSQTTSSPSPVLPSHPIRMPEPTVNDGRSSRAPPSHLKTPAPPVARPPVPPSAPRHYNDYTVDRQRGSSRDYVEPRTQDLPPRGGRREDSSIGGSTGLKLSDPNQTPMGSRRSYTPTGPSEQPLRLPSTLPERPPMQQPGESYRAHVSGTAHRNDTSRAYDDRRTQYEERNRSAPSRENQPASVSTPQFNMPPPNGLPPRPREESTGLEARSRRPVRHQQDTPSAPPPDEPRIWLTREESQSLSRINEPLPTRGRRAYEPIREDVPPRYESQHDRHTAAPRARDYDETHSRRTRAVEPTSPRDRSSHGSDDVRMIDRPQSLEGRSTHDRRVSPRYESQSDIRRPPPRARNERGNFVEGGSVSRSSWNTSRGSRDDRDVTWDHPLESPQDRRYSVHGDRPRTVDAPPPPPPLREPLPYEKRTNVGYSRERNPEDASYDSQGKESALQRPSPVRRGTSLLDRLSLDQPPVDVPPPQHSLRERVEPPVQRTLPEVSGLPPRPSAETTFAAAAEMDALDAGRGRGKKRKIKMKRGPFE